MKLNYFMLAMSLLIGGLILYGFCAINDNPAAPLAGGILCTLFLALSLSVSLPEYPRSTTMFRVLAGCVFALLLVIDLIFLWTKLPESIFFITNGLLAAGGGIGLNFIYNSEQ